MRKGVAIVLLACVSLLTRWTRSQSTCSDGPGNCTFGDAESTGFTWCGWVSDGNWEKMQWEERENRLPVLRQYSDFGRLTSRVACPTNGRKFCLEFYYLFIANNLDYDLTVYLVDSTSSSETALWSRSSGVGGGYVPVTSDNNFVIVFEGKRRPESASTPNKEEPALYVDSITFAQRDSCLPQSPNTSPTTTAMNSPTTTAMNSPTTTASTTSPTASTAASEHVETTSQCLSFSHVAHIIGHAVSVVIIIALCIAVVIRGRQARARDPQNSIESPGILLQSINDQAARSKSVSLPPVRTTGSTKPLPSPSRGRKLPPIPQSQDASKTPFYPNTASTGSAQAAPEENAYYSTATPDGYERASAIRSAQENKEGNYTGLAKN